MLHGIIWALFIFQMERRYNSSNDTRLLPTTQKVERDANNNTTHIIWNIMTGVLIGSLVALLYMDVTFGFPLTWTSRVVSTVLVGLQCYFLKMCYDALIAEPSQTNDEEENHVNDPQIFIL